MASPLPNTQLNPPTSKKRKLSTNSSSSPFPTPSLSTQSQQQQQQSAPSPSNYYPLSPMAQNSPLPQANSPLSQASAAAATAMPPPNSTSPIQKPVNTNELQDVLFSSGVDLQAEEQALANTTQTLTASFNQNNHSFSGGAGGADANPSTSMNTSIGSSTVDWEAQAKERDDNRRLAQESYKTKHQNDPFLGLSTLRSKMKLKAENNQLKIDGDTTNIEVLISLALQDRIKELVGTAYTISNHRRNGGPQGLGEWADMAIGEGEAKRRMGEEPDSSVTPGGLTSRKRSFSQANGTVPHKPTLISESAKSLRLMATKEREEEEARIASRQLKHQGTSSKVATPGTEDVPMASSPMGTVAPEPEARKLSAKETRKINQTKKDEALSHQAANATASLMLGGGKKKKYSWMTAGSAPSPSPLQGKSTPGASVPSTPRPQPMYWAKRMGEWNEQGDKGKGIQLRDWVQSLEIDGRETKGVIKAYMKMK